MSARRSIVIGGGAFAGLALALALRQGLGADVAVVVADTALASRPSRDPRATAIVAACRRLFETLGVWGEVADNAQPPGGNGGAPAASTSGTVPSDGIIDDSMAGWVFTQDKEIDDPQLHGGSAHALP